MPSFYFVGVCIASALDQRSNNFSLFNLIEQIHVNEFPQKVPAEVHIYIEFAEAERGRPHELRVSVEDEQGHVSWRSSIDTVTSAVPRYRVLGEGLTFKRPGYFHLVAEIRPAGEEVWIRSSRWPVEVTQAPPPAPEASNS